MLQKKENLNFESRTWQSNLKRKKEASGLGEPKKKVRRELSTNVDIYDVHDQQSKTNIPNLTALKVSKNNEMESLTQKLEEDSVQGRQTADEPYKKSNFKNAQLSPTESKSLNISSTYSAGMKVVEMKDNREWEQILRPRTVRGGLIFCMLSFIHSALTYYFRDNQSAPGYALLGCISFGMAMYAKYAKTAYAFQRKLGIVLLMFAATRLISVAFFIDCSANTIGSTCTQLRQNKYPMRWTMDSVACLALGSYLPSSTFRLLVAMEFVWTLLAIFEVKPKHLAEQGMVCEVMFGLLLLFLCTDSQLRSNERMKKQIACRERTDRIVNHRTYSGIGICVSLQTLLMAVIMPLASISLSSAHHN